MTYKENITAILECYFTGFKEEIIDSACNRILEQEPETGHWIEEWLNEYKSCPIVICSNCGKGGFTAYKEFNYCPNCGCHMVEPQESEDRG